MPSTLFTISGYVQGVFFRVSTKEKAGELGVTGWVKNCDDGSVAVHAEANEQSLRLLEEWVREGPEHADVEHVTREDVPNEDCTDFVIV